MKKVFLNCILLLCALIVGSGVVWADEYSYTFNASSGASRGDNTLGDKTWNISTNPNDAYWANEATGLHIGSNGKGIQTITVTSSDFSGTISKIVVNTKGNGTNGTVAVSVAGTAYTAKNNNNSIGSTFADLEFTGSSNGAIEIILGYPEKQSKNIYIASIEVFYTPVAPGTCATPTFLPATGAVTLGTEVSISCVTNGATIYYTTDGTEPTPSSFEYDSEAKPTINANMTIKAYAVKSGLTDSEVAEAEYTIAQVATPTFSPEAGEVMKDAEITISCATAGATIYYTTDGTIPSTSSSVYNSGAKPTIDDDKTIKAIAVKANYLNSEIGSAAYTYARVKDYNLVTSIANIISGKHYLIASGTSENSVVVLNEQRDNNRGTKAVTFSGSKLQATGAREIVIYGPDKDGYYVLYDAVEKGYLYAASSGSNYLKTRVLIDNNCRFSISIDGSNAAILTAQGTNTRNLMRYNSSSGIFSCYASGQSPIYLFALDDEDTPSETITVNALGWSTFTSSNALDFTGISTISAYQITGASGTTLTLSPITGKVPARTGLLISGASAEVPATFGTISTDVSNNKLVGCIIDTKIQNANPHKTTIYVLVDNDGIAEFQNVASYVASTDVTIPANKAYLDLDGITLAPSALRIVDEENNATGIENIESGEKVVKFIKNGRILFKKNGIVYDALGRIVK